MIAILSETEIHKAMINLPAWKFIDNKICKEFKFNDFRDAITFIVRISFEAEQLNHHPELSNLYNRVSIFLNTHEAGGKVTAKDIELATKIECLA